MRWKMRSQEGLKGKRKMDINKYKKLMVDFLEEKMSVDEFQTQYFKVFKESDDIMGKPLFEILNRVFESADCYWHECLLNKRLPSKYQNNN